jgi:Fe2+ or Zn2+ uptake regulation protein
LRLTNQRLAILEAAVNQAEHFTAEQLLDAARAIDDSVSRATVYRSLPILTECALLREVDVGTGNKFYVANRDTTPTHHAQIVCLDSDKIYEISAPFMAWYGASVAAKLGLEPVSQRLQVHSRCTEFQKTGTCRHRAG